MLTSLVRADGLLIVTSGAHRVQPDLVEGLLGGTLRRADADAVRAATAQPIGGVGPVGHPQPLRTLVDVALGAFDVVWATWLVYFDLETQTESEPQARLQVTPPSEPWFT